MDVSYVTEGNRTRPEPALDDSWSKLEQLQWKAAFVSLDTGLEVRVTEFAHNFSVMIPGIASHAISGTDARAFDAVWNLLNGVEFGAQAISRTARSEVCPNRRDER